MQYLKDIRVKIIKLGGAQKKYIYEIPITYDLTIDIDGDDNNVSETNKKTIANYNVEKKHIESILDFVMKWIEKTKSIVKDKSEFFDYNDYVKSYEFEWEKNFNKVVVKWRFEMDKPLTEDNYKEFISDMFRDIVDGWGLNLPEGPRRVFNKKGNVGHVFLDFNESIQVKFNSIKELTK